MKTLQQILNESLDMDVFPSIIDGKNGTLPDSIIVLGENASNGGSLMEYIHNGYMTDGVISGIEKLYRKYSDILDNITVYVTPGPHLTLVYNKPLKSDKNKFAMLTVATNSNIVDGRLEDAIKNDGLEKAIKKLCAK